MTPPSSNKVHYTKFLLGKGNMKFCHSQYSYRRRLMPFSFNHLATEHCFSGYYPVCSNLDIALPQFYVFGKGRQLSLPSFSTSQWRDSGTFENLQKYIQSSHLNYFSLFSHQYMEFGHFQTISIQPD